MLDATTPLRFSHLTTIAVVTTVVAPFTHVFSLLNPYGSTGRHDRAGADPHVHPPHRHPRVSGNNNAWQFVYGCMSEITIMAQGVGDPDVERESHHLRQGLPEL